MVRSRNSLRAWVGALVVALMPLVMLADDAAASVTEEAKARLKAAADFLADQDEFAVEAEIAYDVRQPNGQMIELGGSRRVSMDRPGRLRIEFEGRDTDPRTLYFDGKTLSLDLPVDKAYVAVERPGTLYQALNYLVEDLGTPAPLEDILSENLYEEVDDQITSGAWLGEERLGGRSCDHLAFRTEPVDAQIWVETGDRPLLCRIIVTYKNEAGTPQFRAVLSGWDLDPDFDDDHFAYAPPSSAEKLTVGSAGGEIRRNVKGGE